MNLDNLSIRNKILLGVSVAMLLMVVVSVTVYFSVKGFQETTYWVEHTQGVITNGNQLMTEMVNMETGMRGFLITGKDEFLEPYDLGNKNFTKLIAETKELVREDREQMNRLEDLDDQVAYWVRRVAEPQIDFRRRVDEGNTTLQEFEALRTRDVGKKLMDDMRRAVETLETDFRRNSEVPPEGLYLVKSILLDVVNMETGQRGFLLSGEESFLEPFKSGQRAFDRHIDDLIEFANNSKLNIGRNIDEIKGLLDDWLKQAAEPEIEARRAVNGISITMTNLENLVAQAEGKRYVDEIRSAIDGFIDVERQLMVVRQAEETNSANWTQIWLIAGTLLTIILGVLAALFIANRISTPMSELVQKIDMMAQGDVEQEVSIKGTDEVAKLGASFNMMVQNLKAQIELTSTIAQGDLAQEVQLVSRDDTLGKALKKMTENLNDVLFQVTAAAEQVADGARQLADTGATLSQGASQQSASLEEISSSMEEMNSQTQGNADNAGQANQLASIARQQAEAGNQQMGRMLESMKAINESSENISNIIKTIEDIAFQTNVLAINAAVEAARAGVHGKGFAVVAEEVRNLAQRSAAAAKETTAMISDSVKKAEIGAKIADETASSLKEIVIGVSKVTDLISEISSASNEQARGVSEINRGLNQLNSVTQQNAQLSQESSAASETLTSQAEALQSSVARFKLRHQTYDIQPSLSMGNQSKQLPSYGTTPASSKTASKDIDEEKLISFQDEDLSEF